MPVEKAKVVKADEAEAARQAMIQTQINRRTKGNLVPMPNGVRMEYRPAIEPRFQGMDVSMMLGDPASILKTAKKGYKYIWKKRTDRQTAAWIRAGIIRPIEVDEIDTSNPGAQFFEDAIITPNDAVKAVCWESQALFEMSPKWAERIYGAAEDLAISRIAQQPSDFADKIEKATEGAYAGSFSVKN